MSGSGSRAELTKFFDWFSVLPFKHKIVIAGNHDFFFEQAPQYEIESFLSNYPSVIYLNDSGIEIDGYKIWGSPVTPYFHNWAFNRIGDDIKKHWDLIPSDTNILITHGPIYGYLDLVDYRYPKGCQYLLEKVQIMTDLKLHIFGHIHEGYGRFDLGTGLILINASVLNKNYSMTNLPLIVEL
jgi:Icc-related predicted phosphoesterase